MKNGFVNFTYSLADRLLLSSFVNTFTRRAIGFQWGQVFVGVLIAHGKPPASVIVEDARPDPARKIVEGR